MLYPLNAASQSVDVRVCNDAGLPVTGLNASTFPPVTYSRAGTNADVSITLSNLASVTAAWSSGGLKERGEGVYRLDVPDAIFLAYGVVQLRGEVTDKRLLAHPLIVNRQLDSTYNKTLLIGSGPVWFQGSVVDPNGVFGITQGDAYTLAKGTSFTLDLSTAPDLSGGSAVVIFRLPDGTFTDPLTLTINSAGADDQSGTLEITEAFSAALPAKTLTYVVRCYLSNGDDFTSRPTKVVVLPRYGP
jgi:hypothetical protein